MKKLLAYYSLTNLSIGFVIGLVIAGLIYISSGLHIFLCYVILIIASTLLTPLVMEKSDEMVEEEEKNYTDKL